MKKWLCKAFDFLLSILDPESKVTILTLIEARPDEVRTYQWRILEGHTVLNTVLLSKNHIESKDIDVESFLDQLVLVPPLRDGQEFSLCFDEGRKIILVRVF